MAISSTRSQSEESVDGRQRLRALTSTPFVETDFEELEDGTLLEMVQDPTDSSKSLLAVCQNGRVNLADRFPCRDRVFVPIARDNQTIRYVCLPSGIKPYGSVHSLLMQIRSILSTCLDLGEHLGDLLATFVLSTWFIDQLPVAPYVALVGLPRSGKSTALSVLSLLCRRALLTADITSAAFYNVCDRLTPTLLLDETGTVGERKVLFHLLRTGTTRGLTAFRNQRAFRTFGAKVISWIQLPTDEALNSRCITIAMQESLRVDLKKPTDPDIVAAADELQKQLLQFRLEKYKNLVLPKVRGDEHLHSRARDLYQALALPVSADTKVCEWLVERLESQQESNRELLTPILSAVLRSLFRIVHLLPAAGEHTTRDLTELVNRELQAAGESLLVSYRRVGAALTSLGFARRERTNKGWVMYFGQEARRRIHELTALYEGSGYIASLSTESGEQCDLCRVLLDQEQVPAECDICQDAREPNASTGRADS
jgi:hypothetical protein